MNQKTAIIYARVSTARQAEEELPVEGQVGKCRQKAEELGARVLQVFTDEGISGTLESRPAFQDAISYAQTFQPDCLITWSTSRFARNKVDAGLYKQHLAKAGVELVYASMEIDRESDAGWLTEGIMEIFDEFYSRQIAADTKRSQIRAAQQGYYLGGSVPFGYKAVPAVDDPKRKRLAPDETEAAMVRRIFEMRAEGHGAKTIAMELNHRGHTRRSKRWTRNVVHELLKNETVIGRRVFGRKDRKTGKERPRDQWIVVESHDPIIPLHLWGMVQGMIQEATPEADTGSSRSTHLFTGLLKCGRCGSSMQIESAKGRKKRYWYYHCRAAVQERACPSRRLSAPALDDYLVDLITSRIFTRENLAELVREMKEAAGSWYQEQLRRRQEIVTRLQSVEGKKNRLFEVLEDHGSETPNLGDLTSRLRAHSQEMEQLQQDLANLDAEEPPEIGVSEGDVENLAQLLVTVIKETDNPKKVRAFFSSFVQEIQVGAEEVRIEYDPQNLINRPKGAVHSMPNWLPGAGALGTKTACGILPSPLAA